MLKLAL